jgi:hypothetical protein
VPHRHALVPLHRLRVQDAGSGSWSAQRCGPLVLLP